MYDEKITKKISMINSVKIGAIGGAVGALMMLPYMIGVNLETGSPNIFNFQIVNAILLVNNVIVATYIGMVLHFIAGILIGIIFGVLINKKILPKNIGAGICWGIVAGAISFAALFLPTMYYLPKAMILMMHLEVPSMSQQVIVQNVQSSTAMIINSSMLDHVLFGAVMGAIVTWWLLKKEALYASPN